MDEPFWKRCATCKSPIAFSTAYWVCSVSTCNRGHTALAFCSVACWDSHVPILRHRDAWAEEKTSPSRSQWERERDAEIARAPAHAEAARRPAPAPTTPAPTAAPQRTMGAPPSPREAAADPPRPPGTATAARQDPPIESEILVIASKLKSYIRARSGMNTSDGVLEVLSDRLRELCDHATRRAAEAGRKTVLDRDF